MTEQKQTRASKWAEDKGADSRAPSLKERLDARMAAAEQRRQQAIHDKQFKAGLTSLRIIGLAEAREKERSKEAKFCHMIGCWQEKPCSEHPLAAPPPGQPKGGFAYSINVYDEIQEILPRMYLGNYYAAGKRNLMKQYCISHVLTVGNGITPPEMGLVRKQLNIEDESRENILHHMIEAFAFIDEARGIDPTTPFTPAPVSSSSTNSMDTKTNDDDDDDMPFFFAESEEVEEAPPEPAKKQKNKSKNNNNNVINVNTSSSTHTTIATTEPSSITSPTVTTVVSTLTATSTLVSSSSSSSSSSSDVPSVLTTNLAAPPSPSAVYIHCAAGVSRSASFCIAYCMLRARMTYEEAHAHVLKCRPVIRPNYGFTQQLKLLHARAGDIQAAAKEWVPGRGEI